MLLLLVMGGRSGNVGLRINEGTAKEPKFSATPQVLNAAGKVMNLGFSATVDMADINGDGLNDLISGNNEGVVTIYLNSGTKVEPLFTTPLVIKPDPKNNTMPSKYCTVSVLDYNNDGKKDILIGSSSKKGKNGIWVMYQQ